MNIEYEWTREDLKKELVRRRYNTNIIFLVCGIFLYVLFMYDAIKSPLFNHLIILIGGLIFTAVLMLMLFIATKIYVFISLKKNDKATNNAYGTYFINLTDDTISVQINDDKIEYYYKDITKLKKKKHSFFIRTKEDKLGLLFKEKVIGKDNYQKLLSFVKAKLSC